MQCSLNCDSPINHPSSLHHLQNTPLTCQACSALFRKLQGKPGSQGDRAGVTEPSGLYLAVGSLPSTSALPWGAVGHTPAWELHANCSGAVCSSGATINQLWGDAKEEAGVQNPKAGIFFHLYKVSYRKAVLSPLCCPAQTAAGQASRVCSGSQQCCWGWAVAKRDHLSCRRGLVRPGVCCPRNFVQEVLSGKCGKAPSCTFSA